MILRHVPSWVLVLVSLRIPRQMVRWAGPGSFSHESRLVGKSEGLLPWAVRLLCKVDHLRRRRAPPFPDPFNFHLDQVVLRHLQPVNASSVRLWHSSLVVRVEEQRLVLPQLSAGRVAEQERGRFPLLASLFEQPLHLLSASSRPPYLFC